MKLTIGSTTIEITQLPFRRRDTQKGFFLDITIPKDSISMDELYNLLDGNTAPIVVTEEDGTENTYLGFKEIGSFACEKGVYKVSQVCTSEIEAQLSLAQNKIKEQSATIETMKAEAQAMTTELLSQAEVIIAQGETIAVQNEQVVALMEASTSQLDAIDNIMTEVIPLVAAEAATVAVEQALAAITEKETTEEN